MICTLEFSGVDCRDEFLQGRFVSFSSRITRRNERNVLRVVTLIQGMTRSQRKSGWNTTSSSSSLRIRTTQIPRLYFSVLKKVFSFIFEVYQMNYRIIIRLLSSSSFFSILKSIVDISTTLMIISMHQVFLKMGVGNFDNWLRN